MSDITSVSGDDRQAYDPKYVDKVLRAKNSQLLGLIHRSQRGWAEYIRSTDDLRRKYDVR